MNNDGLDIFERIRLMNTGEYEEYLQEREIEKYKQALQDIKEYIEKLEDSRESDDNFDILYYCKKDLLEIINKAIGSDKE